MHFGAEGGEPGYHFGAECGEAGLEFGVELGELALGVGALFGEFGRHFGAEFVNQVVDLNALLAEFFVHFRPEPGYFVFGGQGAFQHQAAGQVEHSVNLFGGIAAGEEVGADFVQWGGVGGRGHRSHGGVSWAGRCGGRGESVAGMPAAPGEASIAKAGANCYPGYRTGAAFLIRWFGR